MSSPPDNPKIYHIVHADRLPSIIGEGGLWSDAEVIRRSTGGTTIGMGSIKARRLNENTLASHSGLYVGQCVPFYFCPRSVMLYLIYQANHPELSYRGGQGPIVHLEADLRASVKWAEDQGQRWAFTLSNAGSYFFEDRADLGQLDQVDWDAVNALQWASCKDGKQAEFLLEQFFPWSLVTRVGVSSRRFFGPVSNEVAKSAHKPVVEIQSGWYY